MNLKSLGAAVVTAALVTSCGGGQVAPTKPTAYQASSFVEVRALPDDSGLAYVGPDGRVIVSARADASGVTVRNYILHTQARITLKAIQTGRIDLGAGLVMDTSDVNHITWQSTHGENAGSVDMVAGAYHLRANRLGFADITIPPQRLKRRTGITCSEAQRAYLLDGVAFSAALASFLAAPELAPLDYIALAAATAALQSAINMMNEVCR